MTITDVLNYKFSIQSNCSFDDYSVAINMRFATFPSYVYDENDYYYFLDENNSGIVISGKKGWRVENKLAIKSSWKMYDSK